MYACVQIRDGVQEQVLVDDIQVGDVMYLEYGDQVPADAIFIKGSNVKVDEAAMTGESDLVPGGGTDQTVPRPFVLVHCFPPNVIPTPPRPRRTLTVRL